MTIQQFRENINGMSKQEGYSYFHKLVSEGVLNGLNAVDEYLPAVQALPR